LDIPTSRVTKGLTRLDENHPVGFRRGISVAQLIRMYKWILLFLVALSLVAPTSNWADDPAATSGSRWVARGANRVAEVKLGRDNTVVVSLRPASVDAPRSISITFFNQDRKSTTLELKTLSPPNTTSLIYSGSHPLAHQSIIGVEITIPFSNQKRETLSWGNAGVQPSPFRN
jgi:hypothetical protein